MADEPYNINIEAKAQLEEIQKLLGELRNINAEIAKVNGQTFKEISTSVVAFKEATVGLSAAMKRQQDAFEKLPTATSKTTKGIKEVGEESKKTKDEVGGLKDSITGFYMEFGAMGARLATQLPSVISKSIQAFGEEEVALAKLSAAIRSQGGNVSEVLPIMQGFASEMQKITTYGDEQILAMQGVATSMGVGSEQMESVMKSAIGLSSALGIDMATATKAASAAMQGKTELLTRYIPMLNQAALAEEAAAASAVALGVERGDAKRSVQVALGAALAVLWWVLRVSRNLRANLARQRCRQRMRIYIRSGRRKVIQKAARAG